MNRRLRTIQLIEDQVFETDGRSHAGDSENNRIDIELFDACSRAVIHIAEKVGPAVVGVDVKPAATEHGTYETGSGSGVIFSPDGYILTNNHVVQAAQQVTVTLADGAKLTPDFVGKDPATDLAVLRVEARDLPYLRFGDSNLLRVGQLIIVIGSPFGFQSTVSTGVVSAIGRSLKSITGRLIENVIQHTAPLNMGNSGSPLIDSSGRIVGINTALCAAAQGIGFSIPSVAAKWVVSQLLIHGKVQRGYLGITGGQTRLEPWFVRRHKLSSQSAIQVETVDPSGPAWECGIREGDLISAFNGHDLTTVDDLYRLLGEWPVGKRITLTIIHNSAVCDVTVVPTEADF